MAAPARQQADRIDQWWRENRPATADLFARELATARRMLSNTPELGSIYIKRQGGVVRRVLLPKTRNHVYYTVNRDDDVVMIVAVWGAPKAHGPAL